MLTTATTTPTRTESYGPDRSTFRCTALTIAFDAARARLGAALGDLRELVASGELSADAASDLECDYVERHLRRIGELEQRGALACTPDEWQRYVTAATRRTIATRRASDRRERLRRQRTARQCLVVASGRIAEPWVAVLDDTEPDAEAREIRAELMAAHLL